MRCRKGLGAWWGIRRALTSARLRRKGRTYEIGRTRKARGVNLGNWLVLEKWMGSSPLAAARSDDDRGLIDEFDPDVLDARLEEYRATYVTEDTFAWFARVGVNLVRIPVPYHIYGTAHHRPCIAHLDDAMAWAQAHGIGVLIDLHTVPYGQNGFDSGGYLGMCAWHKDPARVDFVLDVLERLARRYAGHPALWGIEPLNEPVSEAIFELNKARHEARHPERVAVSEPMPAAQLRDFYERFYRRVRPLVGNEVALVFHDRFELEAWSHAMVGRAYANVWIDTHLYLSFADDGFERYDLKEYLALLRRFERRVVRAARSHPILVGEWCLSNHASLPRAVDDQARRDWYRSFADAQLAAWDKGGGGCFWSYRVDAPGRSDWSFEHCMTCGWLAYR